MHLRSERVPISAVHESRNALSIEDFERLNGTANPGAVQPIRNVHMAKKEQCSRGKRADMERSRSPSGFLGLSWTTLDRLLVETDCARWASCASGAISGLSLRVSDGFGG